MKRTLILTFILWIVTDLAAGQIKIPLKLALRNEAKAIPYTRFFTTPVHPCFQLGTEYLYLSSTRFTATDSVPDGKIDEFTSTKSAMEKIFGTVFD